MTAKVLGTMLPTVGLKFVYYYGTMTNDKRTKAIDTFRDDPEVKVMVRPRIPLV